MLRKLLPGYPAACLGLLLTALAVLLIPVTIHPAQSAPLVQAALPEHGWAVCFVGGMEPIPGYGDRQVFELCNGDAWRASAFCLDPGVPAPAHGTTCSLTGETSFFCGAGVQSLALYGLIQTPQAPTDTPTVTATATFTATASFTATFISTPTGTATSTSTITPTGQPTATFTATQPTPLLDTQTVDTQTPTAILTPYDRPRAGGPGNLGFFLVGLAGLCLLGAAGLYALLRKKTEKGS